MISEFGELRADRGVGRKGFNHASGKAKITLCGGIIAEYILPTPSQEDDKTMKESQTGCGSPRIPILGHGCMSATYILYSLHTRILDYGRNIIRASVHVARPPARF